MKKKLDIAMRCIYLLAILFFAFQKQWGVVFFNGVVFAASLFVPYLGRRNKDFYVVDALICATFILSLIPTYFHSWNDPTTLTGIAFHFDKLFHMTGGACLGLFAAILLKKHLKKPLYFYAAVILFALAVGAAWEIFEFIIAILPAPLNGPWMSWPDTILDMVADTLGAIIVAVVLKLRHYV